MKPNQKECVLVKLDDERCGGGPGAVVVIGTWKEMQAAIPRDKDGVRCAGYRVWRAGRRAAVGERVEAKQLAPAKRCKSPRHDHRYDDADAMGSPFYPGYWDEYDERS